MKFHLDWHFFQHLILSKRTGSLVRRISALSAISIFLSVFAFLLVLFVMNGMNANIRDRLIALEPHLVVRAPTVSPQVVKDLEETNKLLTAWGVDVRPFEEQDVILRTMDGAFRGAQSRGVDASSLEKFAAELKRLDPKRADSLSPALTDLHEGEVVIGLDLARSLNLFEGDTVVAIPPETLLLPSGEAPVTERLKVQAIIASQISDLDARLFMYRRGQAFRIFGRSPSRSLGLEGYMKTPEAADDLKARWLASTDPQIVRLRGGLNLETWSERNSALFFALRVERLMIGIFLALAALIAASSILTVMTLLISQKRSDIALLRVLGLSAEATVRLFTRIGLMLSGGAVLAGAFAGGALGLWMQFHPLDVLPDIYYDSKIPAQFDIGLVIYTLVAAGVLVALGAWIPSRQVSEIEPSKVLRQKN